MGPAVFRDYDQRALDAEYDNRAKVAEFPEYIQRWQQLSRTARTELPARLDLAFGPSEAEVLDVFPAAADAAPINVFYHGGYWRALHKDDFSYVAYSMQPAGITTVVVNYALMPGVSMHELIRQCRAALAWVWHHAAEFGADRERIHLSGHSAGGHLVAMMLATDWGSFDPALPAEPMRGGTGISGLYDLEPIRLSFLNADLGLSADDAARASPVLLARTCHAPLALPLGALEGDEYLRQSRDLAAAWAQSAHPPQVDVMPTQDHFSIADQLRDPHSEIAQAIHRQIGV